MFVLAGQSNMDGRADFGMISEADRQRMKAVEPRVRLAYNHEPVGVMRGVNGGSPHLKAKYNADSAFGPEIFLALSLAEAFPNDRFLIIKRSIGSTSLYGRWNPDWDAGRAKLMGEESAAPLYPDLVSYVRELLAPYGKDEFEICAMLWVQGEADSGVQRYGPEPARAYGGNLRRLIERSRQDFGGGTMPFMLLQVAGGDVARGMFEAERSLPRVTVIPRNTDASSPFFLEQYSVGHFNANGMKRMGELFAEAYMKYDPPGKSVRSR